jgi:hypothetical protein
MAGDILQLPEQGGSGQAVALHLLSSLVAADPSSTALADALHRADVPIGLLKSVAESAPHILLRPARKSQVGVMKVTCMLGDDSTADTSSAVTAG